MSRLPSFSSVSSGVTQLLQKVLIPRADTTPNGWSLKAVVCNVGEAHFDTLYATNLIASNISGAAGTIGTWQNGTAIAGDQSDTGDYTKSNVTGFGTEVLGGFGYNPSRGAMVDLVLMGTAAGKLVSNSMTTSVLIGSYAVYNASNVTGTVAIGTQAAYSLSGSNNVFLGTRSGYYSKGSGNVFIGANVGSTTNECNYSNTFLLGNSTSTPLLRGDFASGQLGVNCTPAGYSLDVATSTRVQGFLRVDGSAQFVGSNSIGGIQLSNTNLVTTGTISGLFRNGPTTSNSIGGISLDTQRISNVGYINVSSLIGIEACNTGGSIRLNNNCNTNVAILDAINASAGRLVLKNKLSNSTAYLYGANTTDDSEFTLGKADGTVTFSISGNTGRILNACNSDNTIGGVTLSGGYIRILQAGANRVQLAKSGEGSGELLLYKSDGTNTLTLSGSSGAISNASNSANTIGGVVLSNSPNTFLSNDRLEIKQAGSTKFLGTGGNTGSLTLYNSNSSISGIVLNGGGDGSGNGAGLFVVRNSAGTQTFNVLGTTGQVELCNAGGRTIALAAASGAISNLETSSNSIGGVTLSDGLINGTISNSPISSNWIGGVEVWNQRVSLYDSSSRKTLELCNDNTGLALGSSLRLFDTASNSVANMRVSNSTGVLTLQGGTTVTFDIDTTGRISNQSTTTNLIGGVTIGTSNITANSVTACNVSSAITVTGKTFVSSDTTTNIAEQPKTGSWSGFNFAKVGLFVTTTGYLRLNFYDSGGAFVTSRDI